MKKKTQKSPVNQPVSQQAAASPATDIASQDVPRNQSQFTPVAQPDVRPHVRTRVGWGESLMRNELTDGDGLTADKCGCECECLYVCASGCECGDGGENPIQELLMNSPCQYGETPLHVVASQGSRAGVERLMSRFPDVDAKNDAGETPLHVAAAAGNTGTAQALLKHGANVRSLDCDGATALLVAASEGHLAVVKLLLEAGADVRAVDCDSETAMHMAVRCNDVAVMEELFRAGAAIDARDDQWETPLVFAVREGHSKAVCFLVEHGADVKAQPYFGPAKSVLHHRLQRKWLQHYFHKLEICLKCASQEELNREFEAAECASQEELKREFTKEELQAAIVNGWDEFRS